MPAHLSEGLDLPTERTLEVGSHPGQDHILARQTWLVELTWSWIVTQSSFLASSIMLEIISLSIAPLICRDSSLYIS